MATKRRNVQQGFYDATGFHPIRASADYDDAVDYDSEQRGKGGYRRRNVEQGFYDATGFHPIRASKDYDDSVDYDSESYSRSKRSYGRRNPPKKAPTKKQLAARKRFAAAAKARSRDIAAAKRAAGYRRVKGAWVAPKVTPKRRNLSFFAKQTKSTGKGQGQWGVYKRKKSGGTKRTGSKTGYFMDEKSARRAAAGKVLKRRAKKSSNSVSVMKNGRKLYGAAAAAVLAKRAGGKKRNGTLLSGRKKGTGKRRNSWLGSQIKRAVTKRLHQPIGRRRNSSTPAAINDVHKMFLGRESTNAFSVKAPNGTPANVAVLGPLVCLKTRDETFEFGKGEAWVATDGQAKKLYILGDRYASGVEPNSNFGHITEIRYEARKDHINPLRWKRRARNAQVTEYFHFFGEENGRRPRLQSDRERLLHITGGDYKIRAEGIVN